MTANPNVVGSSIPFYGPPIDGTPAYHNLSDNLKNFTVATHDVHIENVRGKEDITLDTAGFQLFHHPTKHVAFTSDDDIKREYYPESTSLIKKLTGASRVVLFDHTVRRRRPGEVDDGLISHQPVSGAHVDQTPKSSAARVKRHLPVEEVDALLSTRYQIINLWRPINHPALDWPLTLCDFRSVNAEKDVVSVALIYPDPLNEGKTFKGETYGVQHNPEHRWTYFRGVTPEELILIKCFDSVQDGSVSLFTPHTGFDDPSTPEGTPPRESIELRALVFYD